MEIFLCFFAASLFSITSAISYSSNIITASRINNVKKNVFNVNIYNNNQIKTTFTSTLIKEDADKLIFLTTSHSFKALNINESTVYNLSLKLIQFYNTKKEINLNSKITIIYDNKDEDIAIFTINKTYEFNNITTNKNLNFNSFENKITQTNFLYSLGFVTLLDDNFNQSSHNLFFYLKEKESEFLEPNLLFVKDIEYNSGSSGSPLIYKDNIIGIYLGKKINNSKLTPFFKLFSNTIVSALINSLTHK